MSKKLSKNALVTGGTGFIGRHLIKKLISEGIKVRALVRPESQNASRLEDFDVDIIEGDLADPVSLYKAVKGIDTVFHVAGVMTSDWYACYSINIKGTEHLIKAALTQEVQRFIYLSDIEVYDIVNVKKGTKIGEDSPSHQNPKQMGAYIHSRIEAEKLIFIAYHKNGLKATVLRSCMVVGPMGHIFFPQLGFQYKDKIFFVLRNGENPLPLIYVIDLVDGIYKVSIEKKCIGQVYNLVDEPKFNVRSYIEKFSTITGRKAKIISLPYFVPYLGVTVYEFLNFIGLIKKSWTSRSRFRWKHAPVLFDSSKIKKDLNWNPEVSIEEGLKRTFKWYKTQLRS